ncbi:MAG: hypothetical protein ACIARR_08655 [Phycisphaerales bacterium JB059]
MGVSSAAQPASEALVMWGGREPPRGTVTGMDLQGVQVVTGDGVSAVLGWDEVREVVGERAGAFERIREEARAVWRAGVRLEREDWVNAEPVLEELFESLAWTRGPTSSFVSRGLLTCRLARGARGAAVAAWLSALVSEGWPAGRGSATEGAGQIDPETGLVADLAPVWLRGDEAHRMASSALDEGVDADATGRTQLLGVLYQESARFELSPGEGAARRAAIGDAINATDREVLEEDGVSLVLEIVLARVGAEEQRIASRAALRDRLNQRMPGWKEAWVRAGLGRSLVRESDPETRRRGVIQLLHLPARLAPEAPGLASLALAESVMTLRAIGSSGEAELLRRELLERFPRSEGAGLDEIGAPAPAGVSAGGSASRSEDHAGAAPAKAGTPRT